jgi:hypothetical protein
MRSCVDLHQPAGRRASSKLMMKNNAIWKTITERGTLNPKQN